MSSSTLVSVRRRIGSVAAPLEKQDELAPDQHIRVLQTRGGHADSHLARTAVGRGSIDNLKPVGTTEAPDRDNPVARFSQGQILLARHTGEEAAFPATHP